MKYKKSMIILFITIFLFSIAGACASDANATATATVNDHITDEINEIEANNPAPDDSKILAASAGNEILKSSTTVTNHTFDAIESAITEGYNTIYLEPGTYTGNSSINIADNANSFTFIGNSTILDGQGLTQILFASNSGDIKLKNIIFANGAFDGGAAIMADRVNVEIINCTFTNNTASEMGGAITTDFGTVKVINSTFANNKANNEGAAIIWELSNVIVEGCIFTNNTAEDYSIVYGISGSGQITGSVFTNNCANTIVSVAGASCDISNSIFLNNNGTIFKIDYESNTNYNWFGHTESNYKDDYGVMYCSKWLFLNAIAVPDTINMSDTSNITFTIWEYDSSTNTTSPFDKNLLKPVDLKITAEKGNLSSNTAKFDETVIYTPNSGGKSGVTASMENASYTIYINVSKGDPNLSLVDGEVPYSQNTTLTLNYNSQATGKVNITLKGKNHKKTFTDLTLNSTMDLGSIIPDEYDVTVTYSGDDSFTDATATGKLTVLKIDSDIKVKAHDINVTDADGVMFTVTLPENATGNMTISNGKTVDVAKKGKVKKGKLVVEIKNDEYPVGEYEWTFTYLGDDIYKNSTDQATSNILIIESKITPENKTIEMIFDDKSKVNYTTDPEGLEAIKFESTNESVVTVTSKGVIKAVGAGKAKIIIKFDGNENYTASNATVSVTVEKAKSTLTVPDVTFDYGKKGKANTTFTGATGINATVNDTNAVVEIDGSVITVSNLTVGTYTLTVTTLPDENHKKTTKTADITVNKVDSKVDVDVPTLYYASSANVTATYDGATGITAVIADKNLTVEDDTIIIPGDLDVGPYILTVTTIPDSNHNNVTKYFEIYVNAINSTIEVDDAETDYGKSVDVNVTYGGATGITAKLDGKNMTVEGNVITIPDDLNAGTYNLTVTTIPDENHDAVNKTVSVTVNKVDSTISAKNIKFEYGLTGTTTVTYTGANGINATINKGNVQIKGNVISVSDLNPGIYALNITTIPDDNHNAVSKIITVTVNKASTNLTASGIVTVYNINKYLRITLKDNKNNSLAGVNITVNKNGEKTYTTNKNGQVNINTKLWAPGTYVIKITFAGNQTHAKAQATAAVISLKAMPKLTAKNKVFKSTDKTKKYTVSLKNNVNAAMKKFQVRLIIGKTTYKASTNSKGIATFKLTKLTKTSQATVKYLGNKYYYAVSKKVKLTVKTVFKTIAKGSKNHAMVKKIQKALIKKGYYKSSSGKPYKVDGNFGDLTVKAVKQFQKAKKLKVTGKVDEKTAKKLGII